jgi:hypothetical protein
LPEFTAANIRRGQEQKWPKPKGALLLHFSPRGQPQLEQSIRPAPLIIFAQQGLTVPDLHRAKPMLHSVCAFTSSIRLSRSLLITNASKLPRNGCASVQETKNNLLLFAVMLNWFALCSEMLLNPI